MNQNERKIREPHAPDRMRKAVGHFPWYTAIGADLWSFREIAKMPEMS